MMLQGPEVVHVDWFAVREIAESFFYSVAATAISLGLGVPIVRAWIKRWERREQLPATEVAARLARIEHTIDAVAIEIERVGESQRFLTRLGAERPSLPEHIADRGR
jgi:hypothetical protein